MIEETCPEGLSHKLSTDEVLINIDALKSSTFNEVNRYILSCLLNNSMTNSKNIKKKRSSNVSDSQITSVESVNPSKRVR